LLFILLAGSAVSVLFLSKQGVDLASETPLSPSMQAPSKPLNALCYFDGQAFQQAVPAQPMQLHQADLGNMQSNIPNSQPSPQAKIQAGVVPHHLLAADLIAEFMHTAAEQSQPGLVILLAPNHQELGDSSIQSTIKPWRTAFGQISGLQTATANSVHSLKNTWLESVMTTTNLKLEPKSVQQEHGIGNLLAYVKYYFPQAAVLPITFKSDLDLAQAQALSYALLDLRRAWQQSGQSQPAVLVIASIDFAHQVDQAQAELNQQRVLSLMQAKQYQDLLRLDQHYLDSAPALVTLLLLADKQGWQRFQGKALHSSQVLQQPYHPGTGYLQLVFTQ
jgi:AmmeMemoRadiSam system protein B